MLKAEQIQSAHLEVLQTLESVNKSVQALLSLVPEAPAKNGKPGPRMFTPDVVDSAQAIARALKTCKLDSLVISQTLMNFTEEAREAAIAAANLGDAPPADAPPADAPPADAPPADAPPADAPPADAPPAEGGRVLQGDFTPKAR